MTVNTPRVDADQGGFRRYGNDMRSRMNQRHPVLSPLDNAPVPRIDALASTLEKLGLDREHAEAVVRPPPGKPPQGQRPGIGRLQPSRAALDGAATPEVKSLNTTLEKLAMDAARSRNGSRQHGAAHLDNVTSPGAAVGLMDGIYFKRPVMECDLFEWATRCANCCSMKLFEVTLRLDQLGGPLGLLVIEDHGRIMVERVLDGVVAKWNLRYPKDVIQSGDVLESINGERLSSYRSYHDSKSNRTSVTCKVRRTPKMTSCDPGASASEIIFDLDHENQPLGLLVVEDDSVIRVERVLDGVVARWNTEHVDSKVKPGDTIEMINGVSLTSYRSYYEAKANSVRVSCTFRRPTLDFPQQRKDRAGVKEPTYYRPPTVECSAQEFAARVTRSVYSLSVSEVPRHVHHRVAAMECGDVEWAGRCARAFALQTDPRALLSGGVHFCSAAIECSQTEWAARCVCNTRRDLQSSSSAAANTFCRHAVAECSAAEWATRCTRASAMKQGAPVEAVSSTVRSRFAAVECSPGEWARRCHRDTALLILSV